jgi:hypothetical protein
MHALSVRQPYAERIASGRKRAEFRTWAPRSIVGRDLLIVSSRIVEAGGEGWPIGVAICVVHVEEIEDRDDGGFAWRLSDPRRVLPTPIKGSAALFHVDDTRIEYLSPNEVRRVLVASGREIARENRRERRAKRDPYAFEHRDRQIRGESAATPAEARQRARELADKLGGDVWILRDGLAVSLERPRRAS